MNSLNEYFKLISIQSIIGEFFDSKVFQSKKLKRITTVDLFPDLSTELQGLFQIQKMKIQKLNVITEFQKRFDREKAKEEGSFKFNCN